MDRKRCLLRARTCQGLCWSWGYVGVGGVGSIREGLLEEVARAAQEGREAAAQVAGPSCLLPLPPPQLTVDGHLVPPAGLAHLIAHHALKLGCVLGAGGCEEQGVGGQEPGTDRQTDGWLLRDRPG